MDKYKNESGEVAVLISHGFGAGWSTWNHDDDNFSTMDKTLVEMKLNNSSEDVVAEYYKSVKGEEPYMGGWSDVVVEYIDEGTAFAISEYDGAESLDTVSDLTLRA